LSRAQPRSTLNRKTADLSTGCSEFICDLISLREFGWVGYSGLFIENYWWGSMECLRCGATFGP
jgi:hypothetical protein